MSSETIKSRLHFADLLKSIAIFMVMFYHCFTSPILGTSKSFIYFGNYLIKSFLCISIPLFFLVNGGLLFNKSLSLKKHIIKMLRIVVLVLIWDVLNVSTKSLFFHQPLSISDYLKKLWHFEAGWSNHLWFLMALFVLYIFFPLMKSAYDSNKKYLLFFGVIVSLIVLGNSTANLLFSLGSVLLGKPLPENSLNIFNQFNPISGLYDFTFLYFILGAFLFANASSLKKAFKKYILVFILISSIFLLAIYGFTLSENSAVAWDPVWGGFSTIFALIAIICTYLLSLSYKFDNSRRFCQLIQIISDCSLGIYLMQSIFTDLCRPYYVKLPISQTLFGDFSFTVILFLLCTLLTLILKKIPYLNHLIQI